MTRDRMALRKQRRRRPACIVHAERTATWPPEEPMFCTLRCAAAMGHAAHRDDYTWCPEHQEWHEGDCDAIR